MARKWFQLVGDKGNALTATATVLVDFEDVASTFLRKVKKMYRDSYLESIAASDLTVFANRTSYRKKQKLQKLSSSLTAHGLDEDNPLIVEVPTRRQVNAPIDIPQVDWLVVSEPCPQLFVKDEDQLIELPPSYVYGTGIGRPGESLILYRCPPLVELWNEINRCSIQTYALLWVVGPPGTGKSCTSLAFACSVDRSRWDVIWIHHSRDDKLFNCVWLIGNKKVVCVVKEETIERDLAQILITTLQTQKRTIIFLDGYVKSSTVGEAARLKCLRWHQQDRIKHRLVCVCSMFTRGDYRPDLYDRIPTNVDENLLHPEMRDVDMATYTGELHEVEEVVMDSNSEVRMSGLHGTLRLLRPVKTQMIFKLMSWSFEEYEKAVLDDEFYQSVAHMFPPYSTYAGPVKEPKERLKLLREKYFIAGGSARLMFEVTTEKAIAALDEAIMEPANIESYLQGYVGDSAGAVNCLFARYKRPCHYDVRLVSDYVVRYFATLM